MAVVICFRATWPDEIVCPFMFVISLLIFCFTYDISLLPIGYLTNSNCCIDKFWFALSGDVGVWLSVTFNFLRGIILPLAIINTVSFLLLLTYNSYKRHRSAGALECIRKAMNFVTCSWIFCIMTLGIKIFRSDITWHILRLHNLCFPQYTNRVIDVYHNPTKHNDRKS